MSTAGDAIGTIAKNPAIQVVGGVFGTAAVIVGVFATSLPIAVPLGLLCILLIGAMLVREGRRDETGGAFVHMRSVVNRLTFASAEFSERIVIVHTIERNGSLDRSIRKAATTVAAGERLRWRRLKFITTGPKTKRPAEAFQINHATCDGVAMDHVEVDSNQGMNEVVFLFEQELRSDSAPTTATWETSYSRKGTWNPLREHGEDVVSFKNPCTSDETIIKLVFVGWSKPPTDFLKREPKVGTVRPYQEEGNHVLEWRVADPVQNQSHTAWFLAT